MIDYLENDIKKPKYLFHGSPKKLEIIEQRQSHDSKNNKENEDYAVFLTSSFIIASAYAFKDSIKEMSKELEWEFNIGYNEEQDEPNIIMNNVNISDDIEGYIYIFPYNPNYDHQENSIQYKCHENIKPIDVLKVKFSEFKNHYSINEEIYNYNK